MTQHQLIIEYIKINGSILPAKCYGVVFKDQMLGSETSKRCRELRKRGILTSRKDGKFERFYLAEQVPQSQTAKQFFKDFPQVKELKPVNVLF